MPVIKKILLIILFSVLSSLMSGCVGSNDVLSQPKNLFITLPENYQVKSLVSNSGKLFFLQRFYNTPKVSYDLITWLPNNKGFIYSQYDSDCQKELKELQYEDSCHELWLLYDLDSNLQRTIDWPDQYQKESLNFTGYDDNSNYLFFTEANLIYDLRQDVWLVGQTELLNKETTIENSQTGWITDNSGNWCADLDWSQPLCFNYSEAMNIKKFLVTQDKSSAVILYRDINSFSLIILVTRK